MDMETATKAGWPLSVVRGRTPMGGYWSWHDRLLQAAYRLHLAGICEGCGGYLDETTDAARWSGPHRTHEHQVEKVLKCWGCAHRADEVDKIRKNEKHPNLLRIVMRAVRLGS